jgi:hypothetical protein
VSALADLYGDEHGTFSPDGFEVLCQHIHEQVRTM